MVAVLQIAGFAVDVHSQGKRHAAQKTWDFQAIFKMPEGSLAIP
jgi:hypothetical protein